MKWFSHPVFQDLRAAGLSVGAVTLICAFSGGSLLERVSVTMYFLAVILAAGLGSWRAGLIAMLAGGLLSSFVFIPEARPGGPEAEDWLRLLLFLIGGAGISALSHKLTESRAKVVARARELKVQEEAWRTTLTCIGDGVIATDREGRVTFLNPVAELLTGWSQREARLRPLTEIFHIINETSRQPVENPVELVLREGKIVGLANHTLLIARDGAERPIDDSAAPLLDDEGQILGAVLVFRDVADRREHERRLAEQHQHVQLSAEVGWAITHEKELPELLQRCCESLVKHLGGAFARIWVHQDAEQMLELQASAGLYTHLDGAHARVPVGQFKIGLIAEEREPHLTNTVSDDPRVSDREWALREGMVAFAGYPLLAQGRLLGVMGMFARQTLSEQTFQAMKVVAQSISAAIARHQARQETHEALDYSNRIIDSLREFLLILDDELRVVSANQSYYQFFQVDPKDTVGRPIFDLGHRQWDLPRLRELLQELLDGGNSFAQFEHQHDFPGLGPRVMSMYGRRFRRQGRQHDLILISIQDITARRQMEYEKGVTERRFHALVEQVRDFAVFMIDTEGRATTWNVGVREVLGYEESEFIGQEIVPLIFTPEARQQGIPQWELDKAARTGSCSDDRWMLRKGGEKFWASGITTGLHDASGNLIGYNKIMRDMTERKESEDAVRKLAAELSDANRRKNEFLATLAHELRNPLSPIKNAVELMESHTNPEEIEELRQLMSRQVQQLIRLIDDLMDVSRISRGVVGINRKPCDLKPIIQRAVEASTPFIAESSHQLCTEICRDPLWVDGDAARLAQVVTNLLNNAAKYTPAGGRIQLIVGREGNEVRITVSDNGIGIMEDKLEKVFEMFTQMDVSQERGQAGMGIGLTLVKKFVEMHGGIVKVRSQGRGHGSEFTFTLPLLAREASDSEETEVEPEVPIIPRRILVVEDTKAIAVIFGRLLQRMGHTVELAENGRLGLDVARRFVPEVIFSDISMPEMNGHELARELRADGELRNVYLVAMTGYGQSADRENAIRAGFDQHMVKPADNRQLRRFFRHLQLPRPAGGETIPEDPFPQDPTEPGP